MCADSFISICPVNWDTQGAFSFALESYFSELSLDCCTLCGESFIACTMREFPEAGNGASRLTLCGECADTNAVVDCQQCTEPMLLTCGNTATGEYAFCANCHDSGDVLRCDFCSNWAPSDEIEHDSGDVGACTNCRRHLLHLCDVCDCWTRDGSICDSCRDDDDGDDYAGPIRAYHDGPDRGWKCRRAAGEHIATRCYGVELEIECNSGTRSDVADSMLGRLGGFAHCENDGSLDNGFELISQPASLAYWCEMLRQGGDYRAAVESASRAGGRSHDTRTAGLHVHISRAGMSRATVYKLSAFAATNAEYLLAVSRRRSESLSRWADPSADKADNLRRAKQLANKYTNAPTLSDARYVAFNVCEQTIECRIFRGTLRPETILGAVQWCDALVEWCSQTALAVVESPESWRLFAQFLASSPARSNRAEAALSDLYCREFAARPKMDKRRAA